MAKNIIDKVEGLTAWKYLAYGSAAVMVVVLGITAKEVFDARKSAKALKVAKEDLEDVKGEIVEKEVEVEEVVEGFSGYGGRGIKNRGFNSVRRVLPLTYWGGGRRSLRGYGGGNV